MFTKFKNSMKHEFEMTDLGKMKFFFGSRSLAEIRWNFYRSKKVCSGGVAAF